MIWDGTVTLGNALTIGWVTLIAIAWWVKFNTLLKEYPLHKHIGSVIIYPAGTRLDKNELNPPQR
jgi:hypothetical protein